MTINLTIEQGMHIKKNIAKMQEDRRNGIAEVFPPLSDAQKKALNLVGYEDEEN